MAFAQVMTMGKTPALRVADDALSVGEAETASGEEGQGWCTPDRLRFGSRCCQSSQCKIPASLSSLLSALSSLTLSLPMYVPRKGSLGTCTLASSAQPSASPPKTSAGRPSGIAADLASAVTLIHTRGGVLRNKALMGPRRSIIVRIPGMKKHVERLWTCSCVTPIIACHESVLRKNEGPFRGEMDTMDEATAVLAQKGKVFLPIRRNCRIGKRLLSLAAAGPSGRG